MTAIDAGQRLALLLRTHVSAFQPPPRSRRPRAGGKPAPRQPADLAAVVAQRIQALGKDDPERKRKALRIFLESVLLQHLDADLLRDPSFAEMVDSVQGQMEGDREIAAAAEALSEILLAGGSRRTPPGSI
jgi:hypothetical protein